jgi:heat shock protein HslJ
MSPAQVLTEIDWHLAAIDGVAFKAKATLRFEADGTMRGRAPCNSWGAANEAELPALKLGGIRATRMACARMADEQAFFTALLAMTEARRGGTGSLILTGPDGQNMEFVTDPDDSRTV